MSFKRVWEAKALQGAGRSPTESAEKHKLKGRVRPEPRPWKPREEPAVIGSLSSLLLGSIMGIAFGFHRKKI